MKKNYFYIKKQKGFILIEIIICIALISLIGTISVISVVKNKNDDKTDINKNVISAALVYLEDNEYFKGVLEQEDEVFLKYNELVDKGLIQNGDYDEYKDKCFRIYFVDATDGTNSTAIEFEDDTSKCDKKIVLKKKATLAVKLSEALSKSGTSSCYINNDLKLNIMVDLKGNTFEKLIIEYKENSVPKFKEISKTHVTIIDDKFEYNDFKINDGYSDIVVKLDTSNNDEKKDITDLTGTFYNDKYNLDILKLEDNKIKQVDNTNQIKIISYNNISSTINDINANINDVNNIKIEDVCGYIYNYNLNKENTFEYGDYKQFTETSVKGVESDHFYHYIFNDGNILYNYTVSNCELSDYSCYSNSLEIYNPLTNEEVVLYSGYPSNASNDVTPTVYVNKINDTTYRINVETAYHSYSSGGKYVYYEEFEYDMSKDLQESIKTISRVYKRIGASAVYSTKHNYCSFFYDFHFLVPGSYSSKTYYTSGGTFGVDSKNPDKSCLNAVDYDDYNDKNKNYRSYMNKFYDSENTEIDDYGKKFVYDELDKNLKSVYDSFDKRKTYDFSYLDSLIRYKKWENDECIILPKACRWDSDENRTVCFIRINKVNKYELELVKE